MQLRHYHAPNRFIFNALGVVHLPNPVDKTSNESIPSCLEKVITQNEFLVLVNNEVGLL
jgi:hypothetical protein